MLAAVEVASDLHAALGRTAIALLAVCALAVLSLWLLRRRVGTVDGAPMRVVARLALDPRRTIYIVDVVGRFLVVGAGDGPMAVLAELDEAAVKRMGSSGATAHGAWGDVLRRALGDRGAGR